MKKEFLQFMEILKNQLYCLGFNFHTNNKAKYLKTCNDLAKNTSSQKIWNGKYLAVEYPENS